MNPGRRFEGRYEGGGDGDGGTEVSDRGTTTHHYL
jgi:hypothetical protein